MSKVTHEKYELPTTFSEEAQDLVNSTLRKTPELRPNIIRKETMEKEICSNAFFFVVEIRDHPFFSKDFSRSSQSNNYKYPLVMILIDFFSLETLVYSSGDPLLIDHMIVVLLKISDNNVQQ